MYQDMEKRLIYICLFQDKNYIQLLTLLLKSILLNCKNDKFDILIYTSSALKEQIITMKLENNLSRGRKTIFHVNDEIKNKEEACSSRLDVFNFPLICDYQKILYLDIDIIIEQSLEPIFRLVLEDKLYALKECDDISQHESEYFGKILFGKEIYSFKDKSGFNSGVLLFNNCIRIRELFQIIKLDMVKRKQLMYFYDQPFIIYNTKKLNLCDNTSLEKYVRLSHDNSRKTAIVHFSGGVSANYNKIDTMRNYLSEIWL